MVIINKALSRGKASCPLAMAWRSVGMTLSAVLQILPSTDAGSDGSTQGDDDDDQVDVSQIVFSNIVWEGTQQSDSKSVSRRPGCIHHSDSPPLLGRPFIAHRHLTHAHKHAPPPSPPPPHMHTHTRTHTTRTHNTHTHRASRTRQKA